MPSHIKPLLAGNWKMNGTKAEAPQILALVEKGSSLKDLVDLLICPPATLIGHFSELTKESSLAIGGQDCHTEHSGAHTGDLSAEMLKDSGASFVILGHSERRSNYDETNELIKRKVSAAWRSGLVTIICIGETETQYQNEMTREVIDSQLSGSIPPGVNESNTVVAYEPVWAIGTGRTPSLKEIEAIHSHIRMWMNENFKGAGDKIRLLYGGSVKPDNAAEILAVHNVNGALVGGASLKSEDFLKIANYYKNSK